MPKLVWDKVGNRRYETGLDRGVLYLPDGSAVPWNGLTAVIENFSKEVTPVYYDGMKINDLVVLGDFSASMKALTYPDEFLELEGLASDRCGIFYTEQPPQVFGLCYRTLIDDDVPSQNQAYKLHIVYNVTAVPSERSYETRSATVTPVLFEWDIVAVPEEIPGFRPTASLVIDSRDVDPLMLQDIEEKLYGGTEADASLVSMLDLVTYINSWYRVKIIDNGDGTWTAITNKPGFISWGTDELVTLTGVNAVYLNDTTFVIDDTNQLCDVPTIEIIDNGDGTWTAVTNRDDLIVVVGDDGEFEIRNANMEDIDLEKYEISDTVAEG